MNKVDYTIPSNAIFVDDPTNHKAAGISASQRSRNQSQFGAEELGGNKNVTLPT